MSLTLNQFNYQLPKKQIAQRPTEPRDHSRLLLINRNRGKIKHGHLFKNLDSILNDQCVLVRNNTQVIPARVIGRKPTGGKVELLLLEKKSLLEGYECWQCLTKPGLKLGQKVQLSPTLQGECIKLNQYTRTIKFNQSQQQLLSSLEKIGQTPIPPYIRWSAQDESGLRKKYQTIYAKIKGSAAAPTAGLHFTPQLNQSLQNSGVEIVELTLHVGLDTFQPVKTKMIKDHKMHTEWFDLNEKAARSLNRAKNQGKKIVAIGTTSTRVLETCAKESGRLQAQQSKTDIFIYPPYQFKFVDGLITNFHLPQSTLLMMVSAFCSSPNAPEKFTDFKQSLLGLAYRQAVEKNYRFYSFGDAMLIH